jgi:chitinase
MMAEPRFKSRYFPTHLVAASALLLALPAMALQWRLPDETAASAPAAAQYKVAGYYPQWGVYDTVPYNVKNVVSSGSAPLLTHLIYAFANIVDNQCASYDTWADYQDPLPANETVDGKPDSTAQGAFAGNFHQLQELKKLYPRLVIMMSIGGGSLDPSVFSKAASPAHRDAFVASCIDMYIKGHFAKGITEPGIFTGIDLDWEFPADAEDQANYLALLEEFRKQLTAIQPGYELTSTIGASSYQWQYEDLNAAQSYVNFFNAMMYDFDGPWNNQTGWVAPLYQSKLDPDPTNNASYAVHAYLEMGIERKKIVFGMPFYAYHWTRVPETDHGLFQTGLPDQNSYQYNQVVQLRGYDEYRDPVTHEPWLYNTTDGGSFWTFDDPTSLGFKTKYVVSEQLGGVMFWELSGDTSRGALVRALTGNLY